MIDWNRVLQLREEVGEVAFTALANDFLSEIDDRLAQLSHEPELLLRDLHYLRGAALNIGFVTLSALCLADEMQLRHGHAEGVDREDLHKKFRHAKKQFLEDLPFVAPQTVPPL